LLRRSLAVAVKATGVQVLQVVKVAAVVRMAARPVMVPYYPQVLQVVTVCLVRQVQAGAVAALAA
jgi:hypothetical protein